MNFNWDYRWKGVRLGRILIGVLVASFQISTYQLLNIYNLQRLDGSVPLWDLTTPLDSMIPLLPESAWIYFSYIPALIVVGLLDMPLRNFLRYGAALVSAVIISLPIFMLLPLKMDFPEYQCQQFSCSAMQLLRSVDQGTNLLPSLHASQSLIAVFALRAVKVNIAGWLPLWLLLSALWYIPIILSTLLTKQHYLLDIPAGFLVAVISWWLAPAILNRFGVKETANEFAR